MSHRIRISRFIPAVAIMGLVLTMVLGAPLLGQSTVSAQGDNSANAKLCQKGGWQDLQPDGGSPFTSQGECVSAGAHGATIVTIPVDTSSVSVTFLFDGYGSCAPVVDFSGFQAGTYFVTMRMSTDYGVVDADRYYVTIGNSGTAQQRYAWVAKVYDADVQFTLDGVALTDWIDVTC